MYMGEHIVSSIGIGTIFYKRFNHYFNQQTIAFSTLIALFIACNAIDFDHLLYYHLDDGTINSLATHPLHLYVGSVIMGLITCSFIFRKHMLWWLAVITSLCTHLASDALAHSVNYRIPFILTIAVIQLGFLYWILKKLTPSNWVIPVFSFALFAQLFNIAEPLLTVYGLNWAPQTHIAVWIIPPTLALIFAALFKVVFRKYTATGQESRAENW